MSASQLAPQPRAEAEDGVDQQPDLAGKGVNRLARAGEARLDAAGLVQIAGEILEAGQGVAGKAETAQARLESGADPPRIGVHARTGGVIEQSFGKPGAPRFGQGEVLPFGQQLATQEVEFFMRGAGQGARIGAKMGAFVGGLIGEGAEIWGQGAEKGGGQSAFRLGGQIDGFQRGDGRPVRRGEACPQPVEGAALAAAGLGEQADGEGRGRVGTAQQFGKADQQRGGLRRERESRGGGRRVGLETGGRGGGRRGFLSGRRGRRILGAGGGRPG